MKKFLLTTIVFFSIGTVVMAQQTEPKLQAQQNARNKQQSEHDAKIIAAKKAYKAGNVTGAVAPKTVRRKLIIEDFKPANTSN